MSDLKKTVQGDKGVVRSDDVGPDDEGRRNARTAGTNRDYDEAQESKNQGHGTPREKRGGDAGESHRELSETDREQRDLGGPGG